MHIFSILFLLVFFLHKTDLDGDNRSVVETDRNLVLVAVSVLKLTSNAVSVTVPTPHFTFGFGRNYMAADRNWPKLE